MQELLCKELLSKPGEPVLECGAPAEVIASGWMNGVDHDGEDALIEICRVQCAAGHWYDDDSIGGVIK